MHWGLNIDNKPAQWYQRHGPYVRTFTRTCWQKRGILESIGEKQTINSKDSIFWSAIVDFVESTSEVIDGSPVWGHVAHILGKICTGNEAAHVQVSQQGFVHLGPPWNVFLPTNVQN